MLSDQQDINLKKLALFDCTEGLTKPHSEEDFHQIYGYFRAKVLNGSFSEKWLAEHLIGKHEEKMRVRVVDGFHEEIETHFEVIISHIKKILDAYGELWKVRLTYPEKKQSPQKDSSLSMDL
tara:strand:+ start:201 stop:566 length:366 start_codon:yes stop_codon:yes gene_type:complete